MQTLAIYCRSESGAITYHGEQEWASRAQVIEYYFRPRTATVEPASGWSHSAIAWHGDIGFGEAGSVLTECEA